MYTYIYIYESLNVMDEGRLGGWRRGGVRGEGMDLGIRGTLLSQIGLQG